MQMRFIVCFLMTFTILLTATGSNSILAGAQQFGSNQVDIKCPVDESMSHIPNETVYNDNQSAMILDPMRENLSQVESGAAGEVGPPGPLGLF